MFSEETKAKIKELYADDKETAEKLLMGDGDAIGKMALNTTFTSEEIIYAYENNKVDELYHEALKKIEKSILYHKMCLEYNEYHYNNRHKK